MKNKNFFRMLLMAFLAVVGLTACSDDDGPKDSAKKSGCWCRQKQA